MAVTKAKAAIHLAFVGNSMVGNCMVGARYRAQFNHLLCLTGYSRGNSLSASPGCSCGRFNTPSESVKQGRRQEPCTNLEFFLYNHDPAFLTPSSLRSAMNMD